MRSFEYVKLKISAEYVRISKYGRETNFSACASALSTLYIPKQSHFNHKGG